MAGPCEHVRAVQRASGRPGYVCPDCNAMPQPGRRKPAAALDRIGQWDKTVGDAVFELMSAALDIAQGAGVVLLTGAEGPISDAVAERLKARTARVQAAARALTEVRP